MQEPAQRREQLGDIRRRDKWGGGVYFGQGEDVGVELGPELDGGVEAVEHSGLFKAHHKGDLACDGFVVGCASNL